MTHGTRKPSPTGRPAPSIPVLDVLNTNSSGVPAGGVGGSTWSNMQRQRRDGHPDDRGAGTDEPAPADTGRGGGVVGGGVVHQPSSQRIVKAMVRTTAASLVRLTGYYFANDSGTNFLLTLPPYPHGPRPTAAANRWQPVTGPPTP